MRTVVLSVVFASTVVLAQALPDGLRYEVVGAPDLAPAPDAPPSVLAALPAQLGLKLESSTAEREVLVIDRLERPSEN